jgi:hypothetical protein
MPFELHVQLCSLMLACMCIVTMFNSTHLLQEGFVIPDQVKQATVQNSLQALLCRGSTLAAN